MSIHCMYWFNICQKRGKKMSLLVLCFLVRNFSRQCTKFTCSLVFVCLEYIKDFPDFSYCSFFFDSCFFGFVFVNLLFSLSYCRKSLKRRIYGKTLLYYQYT